MVNNEDKLNKKSVDSINTEVKDIDRKLDNLKAGLFFAFTATIGLLSGFGISFIQSKKKDSKHILKKIEKEPDLYEHGVSLARRALLRATLYSVSGVSLLCVCVWKLSGANNFQEFRHKVGNALPRIKRKDINEGRTEFKNLTELFQYIIDEDNKEKENKKQKQDK